MALHPVNSKPSRHQDGTQTQLLRRERSLAVMLITLPCPRSSFSNLGDDAPMTQNLTNHTVLLQRPMSGCALEPLHEWELRSEKREREPRLFNLICGPYENWLLHITGQIVDCRCVVR
jgi:hypothetical protein